MKITDRFTFNRANDLKKVFKKQDLVILWRKEVKQQLRDLPVKDLYDYYDFNYNIENRCELVCNLILNGTYKTSNPLIYRHEKKLGISRHIMIPTPSDALVFQAIVNKISRSISPDFKNKCFYTRSKNMRILPHEFNKNESYPDWSEQWKKYQKEIYKFSKQKAFLVVTDLANYFDSILLRDLRSVIASMLKSSESLLDLLFNLIEQLSWNPDYLPTSLRGLPTINIVAPRFLAHVYLFEIDKILDKRTRGNSVRWMDDINFGVDSIEEGKEILGSLSDVLKGRGLALNLAKTEIYTSQQAQHHFLFKENIILDSYDKNKKIPPTLEKDFKKFLKGTRMRNWDKIIKRYYTIFGDVKSQRLLKYSTDLFYNYPTLRENILKYVCKLGFNKITANFIMELTTRIAYHDDVTQFFIIKTITDWKIPINKLSNKLIKKVHNYLCKKNDSFSIYCFIWFGAKYLPPNTLRTYIELKKTIIKNDPFLCRQVTAIIPRIYPHDREYSMNFLQLQINGGVPDAASLANNLHNILKTKGKIDKKLFLYLFPTKKQSSYPLAKFLILYSYIASFENKIDNRIIQQVKSYVDDPWYLKWLEEYYIN